MSDFKHDLRRYIDGLEEPVSVQETMSRGNRERRFRIPVAVMAGAAVVLLPALVLGLLRLLPSGQSDVADTSLPPTTEAVIVDTTTTMVDTTATPTAGTVEVPNLDGLTEAEGRRVLEPLGLELEIVERYPSRSDFGTITAQDPLGGDTAETGSTVAVGVRVEAPCLDPGVGTLEVPAGSMAVDLLFECAGDGLFPDMTSSIPRAVPSNPDLIEATLVALLSGLTEEERLMGYGSFFTADSAGALNSLTLNGNQLIVDFNDAILIGSASTTTGGLFFMAQLQANLFQFDQVEEIEFRLDGSCNAFYGWLQGECQVLTRGEWEETVDFWQAERGTKPQPGQGGASGTWLTPTEVRTSAAINEAYAVANLVDGDLETEWQANPEEVLTIEFRWSDPVTIGYLEIYNITDYSRFLRNFRIKGYSITTDDLPGIELRNSLEDKPGGPQRIELASIATRTLTVTVLSTYEAEAVGGDAPFAELVVAEVKVWGNDAE